jgi:hypothetical protein
VSRERCGRTKPELARNCQSAASAGGAAHDGVNDARDRLRKICNVSGSFW